MKYIISMCHNFKTLVLEATGARIRPALGLPKHKKIKQK